MGAAVCSFRCRGGGIELEAVGSGQLEFPRGVEPGPGGASGRRSPAGIVADDPGGFGHRHGGHVRDAEAHSSRQHREHHLARSADDGKSAVHRHHGPARPGRRPGMPSSLIRQPIPPGQTMRDLADTGCKRVPGCYPSPSLLAGQGVYLTNQNHFQVQTLPTAVGMTGHENPPIHTLDHRSLLGERSQHHGTSHRRGGVAGGVPRGQLLASFGGLLVGGRRLSHLAQLRSQAPRFG